MPSPGAFTVMVIDDDDTTRVLLDQALRELGGRVRLFDDGLEALPKARQEPPDLILMDLAMPEPDGFQMLQILRLLSFAREIPVLVVTSRNAQEDVQRAVSLGAIDVLLKPIQKAVLSKKVLGALRRADQTQVRNRRVLTVSQETRIARGMRQAKVDLEDSQLLDHVIHTLEQQLGTKAPEPVEKGMAAPAHFPLRAQRDPSARPIERAPQAPSGSVFAEPPPPPPPTDAGSAQGLHAELFEGAMLVRAVGPLTGELTRRLEGAVDEVLAFRLGDLVLDLSLLEASQDQAIETLHAVHEKIAAQGVGLWLCASDQTIRERFIGLRLGEAAQAALSELWTALRQARAARPLARKGP